MKLDDLVIIQYSHVNKGFWIFQHIWTGKHLISFEIVPTTKGDILQTNLTLKNDGIKQG